MKITACRWLPSTSGITSGPLNERPGRTGFAHLFEHMMFEGSEHVGEKAHIKYVQSAGATDVNGTTDFRPHQLLRDDAQQSA